MYTATQTPYRQHFFATGSG